ncbi:hypothetical protein RRG08_035656 [Elysia crispata]|uniref:G-protein coupled receptors family 1 profile domain-containing protein n=1 Tax=Elysia crispata TaxID=231223 RepID=A0AAE0YAN9_9GAST|nr:hypothetical protein RRG08_035656 [Elysia crispata]
MTSAWAHRWLWGRAGSVAEGFLVYFLGLSSMYILMAIAVDRYIAISKPLLGAKITKKMAVISCGMCFVGGFLWSVMPLMGWNEYTLEGAGISSSVVWESTDPSYTSFIYVIFFACLVLPLCVMFYSYYGVLNTLRSLNQNSVWDMNSRVAKKNLAIEKKMFKTAILIIGAFLFCWLPYAIVSFIAAFAGHHILPSFLATVPPIFAKTQGLASPIILVTRHKAFQRAFVVTFIVGRRRQLRRGGTLTPARMETLIRGVFRLSAKPWNRHATAQPQSL